MKVILMRDVAGLGEKMEAREVSDGYARNYLFPRGLAIPASAKAEKNVHQVLEQRERHEARRRQEQQGLAGRIQSVSVRITARAGADGRLYGSVTPQRIAQALKEQHHIDVDRRKIRLSESIKDLGSYQAHIDLGPDAESVLGIEVVQE
jgi:large subunit ribosomal protein L9